MTESTESTFFCAYCMEDHGVNSRAKEHVIPERIKNASYTLNDTCKFWNNFFARTFEGRITTSSVMDEILSSFGFAKSKGEQYLGPVTTKRGTTEHRWRVKGKEVLRTLPEIEYTDTIVANFPREDGTTLTHQIKLPFKVPKGIQGSSDLADKAARRFEREFEAIREKVANYVLDVRNDRTLDPELHDFLVALGGEKTPKVESSIEEIVHPAEVISDIEDLLVPMDGESLWKFYVKIAWCHACKHLGPHTLREISSWDLIQYLQSGLVPTEVANRCLEVDATATNEILDNKEIDSIPTWYWKLGINETRVLLVDASSELFLNLGALFQDRMEQDRAARQHVEIVHNRLLVGQPGRPREHKLTMSLRSKNGYDALFCDISLFGGLWEASVRLSDWKAPGEIALNLPEDKIINF